VVKAGTMPISPCRSLDEIIAPSLDALCRVCFSLAEP
jgi:hypothetical protein